MSNNTKVSINKQKLEKIQFSTFRKKKGDFFAKNKQIYGSKLYAIFNSHNFSESVPIFRQWLFERVLLGFAAFGAIFKQVKIDSGFNKLIDAVRHLLKDSLWQIRRLPWNACLKKYILS